MSNNPKDTVVDWSKIISDINMNVNTSTLRKCSGSYYICENGARSKHKFPLGCFHQFGISEALGGSMAIVELPNGQLIEAVVNSIRFIEE